MGLLSSAVSAVLGLGSSGGKDQKACLIIEKEGGGDVTFNCQDLKLYFDTSTSYELGGNIPVPTKKKPEDVNSYVSVLMDLVKIRGKLHRPPLAWSVRGRDPRAMKRNQRLIGSARRRSGISLTMTAVNSNFFLLFLNDRQLGIACCVVNSKVIL